jgi:hypothetical protein
MNNNKDRFCVYLDVELTEWIKRNAMKDYRSFSSLLNKLMSDHKNKTKPTRSVNVLISETKK